MATTARTDYDDLDGLARPVLQDVLESVPVLGLLQQDPEAWLKGDKDDAAEIDDLVAQRIAARKAKNFAEADRIRAVLAMKGILIEDNAGGTSWRRAG